MWTRTVRSVREIMSSAHLVTCDQETSVRDAARRMKRDDVGSIIIVEYDRVLGIFTERDAVNRVLVLKHDPDLTPVSRVMTRDPDIIRPDAPISEAIRMMDEFRYRHLPVVDNGRLVGVLSIRDLSLRDLSAMAYELEERQNFAEHGW